MLDEAIDAYLEEIETGRKPKTHSAYKTSLGYFFESTGNKPLNKISRTDLLDFVVFLREEKAQAPRSCWNKFAAAHPLPALRLVASRGRQMVLHLRQ